MALGKLAAAQKDSAFFVQTVTDADFKEKVLEFKGVAVVLFHADWYKSHGAIMLANFKQTASENAANDDVRFFIIHMDDNTDNFTKIHGLKAVPTCRYFRNGVLQDTIVGQVPASTIQWKLNNVCQNPAPNNRTSSPKISAKYPNGQDQHTVRPSALGL